MIVDNAQLRTGLRTIHAQLSPAEASAIFDVARLAAAVDNRTDVTEMGVILSLARILFEMAGMAEMPLPTGAIDQSRLLAIGETLVPTGARELAFACAFVVMIHDLELTQEERQLAANLGEALVIEPARVTELASAMESLVRSARR